MKLYDYLRREGLSTYAFAKLSGVPRTRVQDISQGSGTSAYTALKIMAAAPEITLADLIGDKRRKELGLD